MALDLGGRILRSRTVAALASPHGIDRYLTQINPMLAAHEVRARITDIHPEVSAPGAPRVATVTLQPTSTWRGHRAGQHVSVGIETGRVGAPPASSPSPTPRGSRVSRSPSRCVPTTTSTRLPTASPST